MKLDTGALRYLTTEDWRVLQAVEQGSKNHDLVPTPLIQQIAGLRGGSGVHRNISNLAKVGLIAKVKNAKYDGYRLTYGGLDYLALNTHRKSSHIYSLGNQIGVGKESDIYITASPSNRPLVLKLHRLGRISFRTVKANRDYLRNRQTGSWMYLSRLAAQKEHAFMKVLYREGFPVPEPVAWNRHTVVMEFIDSFPLRQIDSVPDPGKLYAELMEIIVRLAQRGLIHGDFNEFNILVKEIPDAKAEGGVRLEPIVIDFPQTVSTNHVNAEMYFDRDAACVKRYFERRFKFTVEEPGPFFKDAIKGADPERRLDVEVEASGFSRKMAKELERFVEVVPGGGEGEGEVEVVDEDGQGVDDAHEGEVEDDDEEVDEDEQDPQANDPEMIERLESLNVDDDVAVKPVRLQDFGLVPFDLPQEPDVVAAQVKTKKKASGWAI
ncbi:Serine/threonine-protein kinase rio2 [Recurvomyces mirabilis]|uniref:Serine/threonine-protein kinase RIO2 n=1 Tax=Recurvomyces mirabilis TaxID=574656 RepID=A0AAE1C4X0_9PEZI|nr:Serine/threonine-protein kinase rio2 [Recurvomyces mirabilis]KAK5160763.1 Serine/threonine-protein kinase rio2 [Recurvomyces mirabilis]